MQPKRRKMWTISARKKGKSGRVVLSGMASGDMEQQNSEFFANFIVGGKTHIKNTHMKHRRGPEHKGLRVLILHVGVPLLINVKKGSRATFLGWLCVCVYVCVCVFFREILLVSVKFLSTILGPKMAAPIFYGDAWKMRSFCRKNPCP